MGLFDQFVGFVENFSDLLLKAVKPFEEHKYAPWVAVGAILLLIYMIFF